tara:strand:+ start:3188 stop:3529 length:342 start_codon:yes stop_codon:yes gene_type:complete
MAKKKKKKKMTKSTTERGFTHYEFMDSYGAKCSVQKSSSAMEDKVWVGVDDANPIIMASQAKSHGVDPDGVTSGWVKYPIPSEVLLSTRMHLNQQMAKELINVLQKFVDTGGI